MKLVEGFTALGFAYGFETGRIPASICVEDGHILLTLLDTEDDAQKFMEFDRTALPKFAQFQSAEVTLVLSEMRFLRGNLQLLTQVNTRSITCNRAVRVTSDKDYSEVNGMRCELEGFAHWSGLTAISMFDTFSLDDKDKTPFSTLTAEPQEPINLGTLFSVSATSGVKIPSRKPHQQEYTYLDMVTVRTKTDELRAWDSHREVHRMMQDLMCLVYDYPCELEIKEVFREDDQSKLSQGGNRKLWAEAIDSNFGRSRHFEPKRNLHKIQPLFTLKDTSLTALEEWLENYNIWARPTWIAVEAIFQPYLAAESRMIQIAVAMEALGYAIWKYEDNDGDDSTCGNTWCKGTRKKTNPCEKPGCNAPNAVGYFKRIAEAIPFDDLGIAIEDDSEEWAKAFNQVYKSCKHADHSLPDGLDAHERADQGVAVMRCWLAKKLGIDNQTLIKNWSDS